MKIIVTGGTGLLGAMLAYSARNEAVVLAIGRSHRLREDGFAFEHFDLADSHRTRDVFRSFRPDWVCHAAAMTSVDGCERDPAAAWQQNVHLTQIVCDAAEHCGARLLFISTDSVFDGTRGWYCESDDPNPLNVYARTKVEAEMYVRLRAPSALVVRTNLFGWNVQPKQSLAEWALEQLRTGTSVPGWRDVFFTPLFNGDLAWILVRMMQKGLEGLFHVSAVQKCSKYEFSRTIAEVWNLNPAHVQPTTIDKGLAARPRDTSLSSHKAASALGIAMPDVRDGLKRMYEWERTELATFRSLLES